MREQLGLPHLWWYLEMCISPYLLQILHSKCLHWMIVNCSLVMALTVVENNSIVLYGKSNITSWICVDVIGRRLAEKRKHNVYDDCALASAPYHTPVCTANVYSSSSSWTIQSAEDTANIQSYISRERHFYIYSCFTEITLSSSRAEIPVKFCIVIFYGQKI